MQDSIRFDMKAEAGVDTVRLQFESGADGKVGYKFKPNDDNQWHSYKYALGDFQPMDGTTNFDPSKVNVFQILAEGNAVNGKVIYFDNMWTGNPVFDVIPPDAPQGVAVAKGDYNNLVTWTDVPGETGDVYTIYFSKNPITDIHAAGVDVAGSGIARGSQAYSHVLRAPSNDQSVTYYYAVTSTDQSGNESPASIGTAEITNTAKGYAVISQSTPTFTADGDLSEWSGIKPFRMFPSDGSGTVVVNTKIDGDNDCSANGYVAIDQTYLYVAFDVTDDIVFFDPSLSSWLNDNVDLFIGLYDFHGKTHTSLKRGATPDYHFRFAKDRALVDGITGGDSILVPGDNYYWAEKFPSGYVIEAKIPLAELASRGKDSSFRS